MVRPIKQGRAERMSYSHIDEVIEVPDLIEVQKNSYQWFLDEGLMEVLEEVSPIKDFSGDMELSSVFARDLQLQTVSGDMKADDITVIGSLDIESVSGDLNGRRVKCDEISIQSVSGDVQLFIDGDKEDYEIREESIGRHKVHEGSGSKSLSLDTVSGDISYRFSKE